MSKTVQLLLTESVDNLGIVGDVVTVRTGFARNFLLPNSLAITPTDEAIAALAEKRAVAEREQAALRAQREQMISELDGFEITLQRSCNDLGMLYGSVTQQDIADALAEQGHIVKAREVRLPHTIKRIDSYMVPVKVANDLEAEIKVWVVPDRELDVDDRDEMEFDNEGNLIERRPGAKRDADAPTPAPGSAPGSAPEAPSV
ncbi:MAG: 50S ribosomal protein L9 [Phycisphaerales bacterium]|nr:MAG: 50S ribosomal protein L9 [Phycisphaerales bacterium]